MQEEWRQVSGWPYEVSSTGRVRGPSGRILKQRPSRSGFGYFGITICRDGERRDGAVHRLVCEAFHGPAPAPGMHCDHINGNSLDNRAENLRWTTPRQNLANRRMPFGERNHAAKLTAEDVRWVRAAPEKVSHAALGRALCVSAETISLIRRGETWRDDSLTIRRK